MFRLALVCCVALQSALAAKEAKTAAIAARKEAVLNPSPKLPGWMTEAASDESKAEEGNTEEGKPDENKADAENKDSNESKDAA